MPIADIEPQDTSQHDGRFFNGVAESDLNADQLLSRDTLLSKWVDRLSYASQSVRSHGMELGAALPFWLDNYDDEPLTVPSSTSGGRTRVMELLMPILDEYVLMSYNTNPATAASFVAQQAMYATQQVNAGQAMPRVLGGVEVGQGIGSGVSYADTTGKASKAIVLADIGTIENDLSSYPSFSGVAIDHWAAWTDLPA